MSIKEQQKRRVATESAPDEENRSSKLIIGGVIGAIAILLLAIGSYFLLRGGAGGQTSTQTTRESILFADAHKAIDITDTSSRSLVSTLKKEMDTTALRIGSIQDIYLEKRAAASSDETQPPVKTIVTASEFLDAVEAQAPSGLLRSLSDEFMYGIHFFDRNTGFLIFTTNSYEKTYSELLNWEGRYMSQNLYPVLHTETTPEGIEIIPFEDVVVKNIDTREVKDKSGKTMLMYAFINPNTLVITANENTFSEILSRYTTPKPVVR